MAGFVRELLARERAIQLIQESLAFPWTFPPDIRKLEDALGHYIQTSISSTEDYPPKPRSLRDGYAVRAADLAGTSSNTPSFLHQVSEVPMGLIPDFCLDPMNAAKIHTGGFLPEGADAVIMLEDTDLAGDWIEIRKAVQTGENVMGQGEEISKDMAVFHAARKVDYRSIGILTTLGVESVPVISPKIGVFSTGDEIVEVGQSPLSPGKIRDVNSWMLHSLLSERGFDSKRLGIVPDSRKVLESSFNSALDEFDVILISGGSSVSVRDFTFEILSGLPSPGLLVRGINISPGKPTLIGGCLTEKKLVFGLPGHPLSCSIVALTLVLPLLMRMCGLPLGTSQSTVLKQASLGEDVIGKSGIEEFIPAFQRDEQVFPMMAKSGYVGALRDADYLIRLDSSTETVRKGESVLLWPL